MKLRNNCKTNIQGGMGNKQFEQFHYTVPYDDYYKYWHTDDNHKCKCHYSSLLKKFLAADAGQFYQLFLSGVTEVNTNLQSMVTPVMMDMIQCWKSVNFRIPVNP